MGTDIYLNWKSQTEDEKKNQFTGFRSTGEDGYLRASIGMFRENQMLRILFPEEYWMSDGSYYVEDLGVKYNFVENEELLQKALAFYLHGVDEEDTLTESLKQQTEFGMAVMSAFSGLKTNVMVGGGTDLGRFADNVKKFCALGKKLNHSNIETYIYISW